MKQKSLKKNAVWNFIYTGTNMLFPLITAPYVSRILGASNLGKVDFARTFSQWFIILAAFGVTTYGVRAISQVRDEQENTDKVFSELFIVNFLFSLLATVIYLVVILYNPNFLLEQPLFIVMMFGIVLNAVNIDWFYQGIEEYNYITKRNFIIKIFSLLLIFIFVKKPNDYVLYGLISVLGIGLSGVLNVIHSRNYATFTMKNLNFKKHMKPLSIFFLIIFVINIYTNLDRTLLGFISTASSVAFLTRAKSVTSMGGMVANSIASVAMPRASYYLKTDFERYKKLIHELPKYMLMLTIPMVVGIYILSPEIMYILGGEDFLVASNLLAIISIVVLLSSLSTFLQHQVLVPSGNERFGLIASIISSVVSIVTNIILIPKYGYIGAGIAVVLAELSAVISRFIFTRILGYNFVRLFNKSTMKYVLASIAMLLPIYFVKQSFDSYFISFILSAVVGLVTYITMLLIFKEGIAIKYSSDFILRIKKKF